MKNMRDGTAGTPFHKILVLGRTGAGKTTQEWTLPGKKFAYLFDPNAPLSLQGLDIDFEEFFPDAIEFDITLKGFNKGAKDDKPKAPKEPTVFLRWGEDFDKKYKDGFFKNYDWLIIDSLSLLSNAVMDRMLYLNNRYGAIEDRSDYRVVGSKISAMFRSIVSVPINLYCTGHIDTFQDEKTQRIEHQIRLPGSARNALPILFTNIWQLTQSTEGYSMLTKAESRGFQDIRTTIQGLKPVEDITIRDFSRPTQFGIGAILAKSKPKVAAPAPAKPAAPTLPPVQPAAKDASAASTVKTEASPPKPAQPAQ